MQDKIQEIMGLVDYVAFLAKNTGQTGHLKEYIESKLRELVREPLSDDEICTMLGIDGSDDWTYTVARAVERAHNITNTSGVE